MITTLKNNKGKVLFDGDVLYPGDYIIGEYDNCLLFQDDGNLVHYEDINTLWNGTILWQSDTQKNHEGLYAKFENGNLRTYKKNREVIWKSDDKTNGLANCLMLIDYDISFASISSNHRRILVEADIFTISEYFRTNFLDNQICKFNVTLISKADAERKLNEKKTTKTAKYSTDLNTLDSIKDSDGKYLKGAIIIIGSLLWDTAKESPGEESKREKWRNDFLDIPDKKHIDFLYAMAEVQTRA